MMSEWNQRHKARFRGEVLNVLAGGHLNQRSRMDDTAICRTLQSLAWDVEIKDVVTILQDMKGRNWVTFIDCKDRMANRVYLHTVEILPDGQDLVDDTTRHPAVRFD